MKKSLTIAARAGGGRSRKTPGYQRDVSVSLNKLGDMRLRRGEADAALSGL